MRPTEAVRCVCVVIVIVLGGFAYLLDKNPPVAIALLLLGLFIIGFVGYKQIQKKRAKS